MVKPGTRIYIFFAVITAVYAALNSSKHLSSLDDASHSSNLDLQSLSDSGSFGDDGYRYKTVKRFRLRHRRAISELPLTEYLPPSRSEPFIADIPVVAVDSTTTGQESAILANDGYRYKTLKRIRYRHY